jgi:Zinc knuckle
MYCKAVKWIEHQTDGITFATKGTMNNGNNTNSNSNDGRRNWDHITCFECGQTGHYANQCTIRNQNQAPAESQQQQGTNLSTHGTEEVSDGGFAFSQMSESNIPPTWILLDNQSTIDLFCSK